MTERSINGNYAIFCTPKNNFRFLMHTSIPLFSQRRRAAKQQRNLLDLYFSFFAASFFAALLLCAFARTWGALLSG